jgi:hypothetical protein
MAERRWNHNGQPKSGNGLEFIRQCVGETCFKSPPSQKMRRTLVRIKSTKRIFFNQHIGIGDSLVCSDRNDRNPLLDGACSIDLLKFKNKLRLMMAIGGAIDIVDAPIDNRH